MGNQKQPKFRKGNEDSPRAEQRAKEQRLRNQKKVGRENKHYQDSQS